MTVEPWPPRWLTAVPESAIEAGRVMEPVVDFAEAFGIVTKDSVAASLGARCGCVLGRCPCLSICLRMRMVGIGIARNWWVLPVRMGSQPLVL